MATYSIKLKNTISLLNDNSENGDGYGFQFKYKGISYIISVHHFLPITKTELDINSEVVELKKTTTINWNELSIFDNPDSKFLLNTKSIKNYRLRFLKENTIIKMEVDNCIEKYSYYDTNIYVHPSRIKNIYIRFLIGKYKKSDITNVQNTYQGLSGSPVLDTENKLIGVFSKIGFDKSNNDKSNDDIITFYGYIIPSLYIIKSLEKKNNEAIFQMNLDSFDNLKLGKYDVQKNKDNQYSIHYRPSNIKLELDMYFLLEGDDNKKITSLDTKTKTNKELEFVKFDYFDFNCELVRNEKNQYKLNTGLISTLLKSRYRTQLPIIFRKYKDCETLNNIWIDFPFC